MYPSYLNLSKKEIEMRAQQAWQMLKSCQLCPRKCGVDRTNNSPKAKRGFCELSEKPMVSSYHSHHWEESCISGTKGSGIIFFTSCNLACVYCQNYEISQLRLGHEVSYQRLSEMMLELQSMGCHNLNLCTPSPQVPQILKALSFAVASGFKLPLVYNTSGYDSVRTLKLLDGIVDIYMPDIKYSDDDIGLKYSKAPNYWSVVQQAVKEMHRQVGNLIIENGLAKKGLLIRHLVLPEGLAGTKKVMEFLAEKISKKSYVNIMSQYYPTNKAHLYPELSRRITQEEFREAIKIAKDAGLHRFDKLA